MVERITAHPRRCLALRDSRLRVDVCAQWRGGTAIKESHNTPGSCDVFTTAHMRRAVLLKSSGGPADSPLSRRSGGGDLSSAFSGAELSVRGGSPAPGRTPPPRNASPTPPVRMCGRARASTTCCCVFLKAFCYLASQCAQQTRASANRVCKR